MATASNTTLGGAALSSRSPGTLIMLTGYGPGPVSSTATASPPAIISNAARRDIGRQRVRTQAKPPVGWQLPRRASYQAKPTWWMASQPNR